MIRFVKIIKVIGPPIIVLLVFLFWIYRLPETRKSNLCNKEESARKEDLVGIVLEKYNDLKNHYNPTLEIESVNGETHKTVLLLNDRSGCFDYILVGDSIIKPTGSLEVNIYRNDSLKVFYLDYGCK
jgi:hypothetical protein